MIILLGKFKVYFSNKDVNYFLRIFSINEIKSKLLVDLNDFVQVFISWYSKLVIRAPVAKRKFYFEKIKLKYFIINITYIC